ncbi:hypothetical protein JCM8097_000297 [Rhodosporidiobolus ruineniae]
MPVPQLPLEVVALVLDHVFEDFQQSDSASETYWIVKSRHRRGRQYALVCRNWREAAFSIVWREVTLDISSRPMLRFVDHVMRNLKKILPHVRSLRTTGTALETPRPLVVNAMQAVLTGSPTLQRIELDHRIAEGVEGGSREPGGVIEPLLPFSQFLVPAVPFLRSLSTLGLRLVAGDELAAVLAGLSRLTRLEVLYLDLTALEDMVEELPAPSPFPPKLATLRMLHIQSSVSASPHLLDSIPRSISPTFTGAALEGALPPALLTWAISSPRLNTLFLGTQSFWSDVFPHLRLLPSTLSMLRVDYAPDPTPQGRLLHRRAILSARAPPFLDFLASIPASAPRLQLILHTDTLMLYHDELADQSPPDGFDGQVVRCEVFRVVGGARPGRRVRKEQTEVYFWRDKGSGGEGK